MKQYAVIDALLPRLEYEAQPSWLRRELIPHVPNYRTAILSWRKMYVEFFQKRRQHQSHLCCCKPLTNAACTPGSHMVY